MTDKPFYPEVFTTINIPKPERRLALRAKHLFDVAYGAEPWDPNVHLYLNRITDTSSASQAFWDYENDTDHLYDRLALTIMRRGLTIAIEHRDFDDTAASTRKSLVLSNGVSKVFTSHREFPGWIDNGSSSIESVALFKESFLDITAHLGLYERIQALHRTQEDQNESNSAIFASAA